MKFEDGQLVEYKGFVGQVKIIGTPYLIVVSPSVIGNPWPISVIVHRSDFKLIKIL